MRSISRTRMMILAAAIVLLAVSLSWYRGEASAGDQRPAQESPGDIRQVNVLLKNGGAKIDDRKVSMEELAAALELFGGKDPENVVVNFFCVGDVPMSEFEFIQETMRKLGIIKILFRSIEGEDFPLQVPSYKALDLLEDLPEDMIIEVVIGKGGIVAGTRNVNADDLEGVIKEKLEETPMAVVVLRYDPEANYEDFTHVMKILNIAGADRVVVKIDKKE